jgi:hypothetical protein
LVEAAESLDVTVWIVVFCFELNNKLALNLDIVWFCIRTVPWFEFISAEKGVCFGWID